ncbi:MAG TPA: hypothetical protein VKG25_19390 [Bryobacteraceae bacterium]|nr:hypothetical protein [Bryobacteraceae bacterium]
MTMPDKPEEQRRQALLHQLRKAEELKAEKELPAPRQQLEICFSGLMTTLKAGAITRFATKFNTSGQMDLRKNARFGGFVSLVDTATAQWS